MKSITPERLVALHRGAPTSHLMETLALNFEHLARKSLGIQLIVPTAGITQRMRLAGQQLYRKQGLDWVRTVLLPHTSDTIQGWAAYALVEGTSTLNLVERLELLRPLANSEHFAVREWAWLAIRPIVLTDIPTAIAALTPWVEDTSAYIRRFAVEVTRPRGVWCPHSKALKEKPYLGLPLLEPMRFEPTKYGQDSVANWLNDAAKDNPHWVMTLTEQWLAANPSRTTQRIVKRGRRSIV